MEFIVPLNGSLAEVSAYISKRMAETPIVLFYGDLGAGKTTLIKSIGRALGLENQMSSPSFGLINTYENQERSFCHMDLYRLNSPNEALDIGLFDFLDSGAVCWIEWPEILNEVWHRYDTLVVKMVTDKLGNRRIFVTE